MPQVVNTQRLINFLSGITGVAAGGNAVVNLDLNKRYHRIVLQCKAVNYTGGTGLATKKITGSGNNDLTVTPTVVNGQVASVAVVAGGTGYTTGDTVTITDKTGQGFVGTVTASGGVVSAVAVTSGGTPSPISPSTLLTACKLLVNGVNMRDITPAIILSIRRSVDLIGPSGNTGVNQASRYDSTVAAAKFSVLADGEFPIEFTDPSRNRNGLGELNAWDMAGQSTFQLLLSISGSVVNPQITGIYEFDYARNAVGGTPFLQPVSQHQFSLPIVAGRNDIITLPLAWPITRMWLQGSTAGQITQVEVYQDGNKVCEATTDQIQEAYARYGFWLGFGYGANNQVNGDFDAAYIADIDQNIGKALKCQNSLIVRVYSAIAQTLTIVQETTPSAYAG